LAIPPPPPLRRQITCDGLPVGLRQGGGWGPTQAAAGGALWVPGFEGVPRA
jgi:hypothetical protein